MREVVTVDKLPFRKAVNGCNSFSVLYHDANVANVSLATLLAWVLSATCTLILAKMDLFPVEFAKDAVFYISMFTMCVKGKKNVKAYVCEFLVSDLRGQYLVHSLTVTGAGRDDKARLALLVPSRSQ